jgi:hypothetical protein
MKPRAPIFPPKKKKKKKKNSTKNIRYSFFVK